MEMSFSARLAQLGIARFFKSGEASLSQGNTDQAVNEFTEAIKLNPAEADYFAYLGWAVFKQDRDDDAQRIKDAKNHLNHALAMNPQSDKALLLLGRLFLEERKVDLAEDYFRRALEVNPKCVPAAAALEGIEKVRARHRDKASRPAEGESR